jgi:hypothetical protein
VQRANSPQLKHVPFGPPQNLRRFERKMKLVLTNDFCGPLGQLCFSISEACEYPDLN